MVGRSYMTITSYGSAKSKPVSVLFLERPKSKKRKFQVHGPDEYAEKQIYMIVNTSVVAWLQNLEELPEKIHKGDGENIPIFKSC